MADGPVSRILCRTQTAKRPACAAIIPLGHGSHRDSSSLPEGFHPRWLAPPRKERVRWSGDRKAVDFTNANSVSRAGSPLLFGLAPRGVFRASDVAIGAVGSYPTFSPLPNARIKKDEPEVLPPACHRDAAANPPKRTRRVFAPAVYSLWHYPWPILTIRFRSSREPAPWRYQARCPSARCLAASSHGVRTFLPPCRLA